MHPTCKKTNKLQTPCLSISVISNSLQKSTQTIGQVKHIKSAEGLVLCDPPTILARWNEYFTAISNEEFPHPPIHSPDPIHGPVPPVTTTEVTKAVKKIKNGKATGPDDIPVDVWKLMGHRLAVNLAALFNNIFAENRAPQAWTTSTMVQIWKGKGDVSECKNYRPIRLLSHTMKIFERVLDSRLRGIINISPNQCGFVKGQGTTDAIHTACLLMEKPIHMVFLDLQKAFNHVPHLGLPSISLCPWGLYQLGPNTLPKRYECCPLPCRDISPVRHQRRSIPRIGPFATALHHLHGRGDCRSAGTTSLDTTLHGRYTPHWQWAAKPPRPYTTVERPPGPEWPTA